MFEKQNKLFSVIVPVYNVEKYLSECVQSILNQDFLDYELILVDDGSLDDSGKICDSYVYKKNNINVIHKKNGGLSDARNEGLKAATGEYIIFIDSDDYFCDSKLFSELAKIIKENHPDIIMYGVKKYFEYNKSFKEKNLLSIDNKKSLINNMIEQNYFKACANDKVIKRKIINDNKMMFPFGLLSEDIEWCANLLKNIDVSKITFLNKNVYVYRQRENSITTTVKEKNVIDIISMIENEKLDDSNPNALIVNSYLAYEYSVVLGLSEMIKVDKKIKKWIINHQDILKYDMSNKVKSVNKLIKLLGINIASKILGIYIKIK